MAGKFYSIPRYKDALAFGKAIKNIMTGQKPDGSGASGDPVWFTQESTIISSLSEDTWILESTSAVDAFNTTGTQKYKVAIQIMKNNGKATSMTMWFGSANQVSIVSGVLVHDQSAIQYNVFNSSSAPSNNNLTSARMSFTDRGFAISTWTQDTVNARAKNTFLCAQRPVSPKTGLTNTAGTAPIMALWHNCNQSDEKLNYGIIREGDRPESANLRLNIDTYSVYNMYRTSLDWTVPPMFDNNSHVIKFAYGFASDRHFYLDELDMVAFVNSGSFTNNQEPEITMYGETETRKYVATWGLTRYGSYDIQSGYNSSVQTTARVSLLKENGGITVTP